MVKDAPNHIPMNMIGLSHTSRKILKDGDILIFQVVLITPTCMVLMIVPKLGSHYPPYAWSLIQSLYDHILNYSVRHLVDPSLFPDSPDSILGGVKTMFSK